MYIKVKQEKGGSTVPGALDVKKAEEKRKQQQRLLGVYVQANLVRSAGQTSIYIISYTSAWSGQSSHIDFIRVMVVDQTLESIQ